MSVRKFGYKRCSTNEDKQDVGRQLFQMEFDKEYVEYASGKNEQDRPVFQELLSELKSGDHVYFQELSRAGRNAGQLLSTIDKLVSRKVTVHFVSESLTLTGDINADGMAQAISKMIVTVMSAMNEFFLTQTKVAVKQGLEAAKAKGIKLGGANPKHKAAMEKNKSEHLTTRLSEKSKQQRSPVTQLIKDMINYSQNRLTLDEIASNLNSKGITTPTGKLFSKASVSRIIKQDGIDYKKKNKYSVVSV